MSKTNMIVIIAGSAGGLLLILLFIMLLVWCKKQGKCCFTSRNTPGWSGFPEGFDPDSPETEGLTLSKIEGRPISINQRPIIKNKSVRPKT